MGFRSSVLICGIVVSASCIVGLPVHDDDTARPDPVVATFALEDRLNEDETASEQAGFFPILSPPTSCIDGARKNCAAGQCWVHVYWGTGACQKDKSKDNNCGCKANCAVNGWGKWGKCTKSCGSGTQTRKRTIKTKAVHGGTACPKLSESKKCNTHSCKVNCAVNSWGKWGMCTKSCGSGTQTRKRTVKTKAASGGTACPKLSESQKCNTHGCKVNCAMNNWAAWNNAGCTGAGSNANGHKCSGTAIRKRTVKTKAANGGSGCPASSQTRKCKCETLQMAKFHCGYRGEEKLGNCERKDCEFQCKNRASAKGWCKTIAWNANSMVCKLIGYT